MDELVIGNETYLSSKRAAKITGYAKDYVGQLCREGRVTAKLVGRSWYVLESSIRDHRFKDAAAQPVVMEPEIAHTQEPAASAVPTHTWESPRYEAVVHDALPPINRLDKDVKVTITTTEHREITPPPVHQDMNAAWQAWFNRVEEIKTSEPQDAREAATADAADEAETTGESDDESEEPSTTDPEFSHVEDPEVSVPIHAIYQPELPVPELRPHQLRESPIISRAHNVTTDVVRPEIESSYGSSRLLVTTIRMVGALIAISALAVALLGSGYVDTYLISSVRAPQITGISAYNR